ncbi:YolD-like family protein [Metabacillus herbersteinensis]|uniref:YolD-like family protein n=1 Tax=Metabacillus herbersteinensis TaxID=283816 RepID=A0ABV6GBV0_9BACI
MLRDRGTKKWTAIMLPEHVKMLRNEFIEFDKVDKPTLDEQQLEDINTTILEAMEYNNELVFTYFENGDMKLYVGRVHYIDDLKKELRLVDLHGDKFYIKFNDLLKVDINE